MCVEHLLRKVNIVSDALSCRSDLAVVVVEQDESDSLLFYILGKLKRWPAQMKNGRELLSMQNKARVTLFRGMDKCVG